MTRKSSTKLQALHLKPRQLVRHGSAMRNPPTISAGAASSVDEAQLISSLMNYGAFKGAAALSTLLTANEEGLVAFAKTANDAKDNAGAMLAFLVATLKTKKKAAVVRRITELTSQRPIAADVASSEARE